MTGADVQVLLLNASGNVDDFVVATAIVPDANGAITVGIVAGPNNNHPAQLGYINLAVLTPVPEPETYALMLAGLGLVAMAAKRQRR